MRLIIVGEENVGKTSLCNSLRKLYRSNKGDLSLSHIFDNGRQLIADFNRWN